jgi:phage tail sheath protein FI
MSIVQQGAINTTALVVPGLYVQIVPPQNLVLNGVPTNVVGVVGTAQWGPVGQPVICSSMADFAIAFGAIQNRTYDLGTAVAVAVQQGASNFRAVRVTDGTDVAASVIVLTSCITFTALYSGTLGNAVTVTVSNGQKASSYNVTVAMPGQQPEQFTNITGSGNALWVAMAAAINSGQSAARPASKIIMATAGVGTTAAALVAYPLASGTDGVTTITTTVLVGVDTAPRKGMYALRGQGCTIGVLADGTDYTQWSTMLAFGLAEGIYMIAAHVSGQSIATAVTNTATAGADGYGIKIMHGDWLWWFDQVNGVQRLVSPQGFVAGRLANLSPEQSSLNKTLYSIVGSQKSGAPGTSQLGRYSDAEKQTLFSAGIDVICNPSPGGNFWSVGLGHNGASNPSVNGDNYTRMTNYIAATLNAGMGVYVGPVINARLLQRVKATLISFLQNMLSQGLLGSLDGSVPFGVVCDTSNNPLIRTALGYVQADVQVQYQGINEKFIVNVEGGQTVQVQRQTGPGGQVTL